MPAGHCTSTSLFAISLKERIERFGEKRVPYLPDFTGFVLDNSQQCVIYESCSQFIETRWFSICSHRWCVFFVFRIYCSQTSCIWIMEQRFCHPSKEALATKGTHRNGSTTLICLVCACSGENRQTLTIS